MRILNEPLLHFLLLGALLFGFHAWFSAAKESSDESTKRIELTAAHIAHLREGYRRQYLRLPDEQELRELITTHLREEVLYREALALGLDREDSIVRRRLAQKMEFLTADLMQASTPDDQTLAVFFNERAASYAHPGRVDFHHVFFSQQKRGAQAEDAARVALGALKQGAAEDSLGDGFLHGFEFAQQTSDDLTALFGSAFTTQLAAVPVGAWSGPLISSYGIHLVLVDKRIPGAAVELATVRERVLRDYLEHQRLRANQSMVEELRQRYHIVIDEAAVRAPAPASPAAHDTAAHDAAAHDTLPPASPAPATP